MLQALAVHEVVKDNGLRKLIGVNDLISSVRYMSMPQSLFVQLLIKQNASLKPRWTSSPSKECRS